MRDAESPGDTKRAWSKNFSYSCHDEAAVQQLVRILERMRYTVHYDKDHAGDHI